MFLSRTKKIKQYLDIKSVIIFLLIFSIFCIGMVSSATPLNPSGGPGYTVTGSIGQGNIAYTITTAGDYYVTHTITTSATNAISINTGGTNTVSLDGRGYHITAGTNAVYVNALSRSSMNTSISNVISTSNIQYIGQDSPQVAPGGIGGSFISYINNTNISNIKALSGAGNNIYYQTNAGAGGSIYLNINNSNITGIITSVSNNGGSVGSSYFGNAASGGRNDVYCMNSNINSIVSRSGVGGGTSYPSGGTVAASGGISSINIQHCNINDIDSRTGIGGSGSLHMDNRGSTGGVLYASFNDCNIQNVYLRGGNGGKGVLYGGNGAYVIYSFVNSNINKIDIGSGDGGDATSTGTAGAGGIGGDITITTNNNSISNNNLITPGMGGKYNGIFNTGGSINPSSKISNNIFTTPTGNAITINGKTATGSTISMLNNTFNVVNGYALYATYTITPTTQTQVYNNIFNITNTNNNNAFNNYAGYQMYTSPVEGMNIVGGSYIAGNYWKGLYESSPQYYLINNIMNSSISNSLPGKSYIPLNDVKWQNTFGINNINGDIYPLVIPDNMPDVDYNC